MNAPLVGTAEIADRLGVSKQRVSQLTAGNDFPKPVAKLAAGPVWRSSVVEKWIARNRPNLAIGSADDE